MNIEELKFPVGKFSMPSQVSQEQLNLWIQEIKDLPNLLEKEVKGLSKNELSKTYRPGGWNIGQIVHHLADSHMNSFIRFKLSLTEESPVIKPYFEERWSAMKDNTDFDILPSVELLKQLHKRWGYLLDNMISDDFNKGYIHPDKNRLVPLSEAAGLYAWHCRHHLAHIRNAKNG